MRISHDRLNYTVEPSNRERNHMTVETVHEIETDIVVAGGGMAGVCAAIAAARHGARVTFIQDRPVLGGNSSSEVRMMMCGASFSFGPRPDARETGIIEELRLEDTVRNPTKCAQMWDLLLWEYVTREPNITLLLNTSVEGARVEGQTIQRIEASRPSTEDRFLISARHFIDCTGDGRLGAEAGAAFRIGREAREEYDESFAPEIADDLRLGSSILFQARDHGAPVPFVPPAYARKFTEEDLTFRPHDTLSYGFWWLEYGGELDTIKDNERIRDELYTIAMGVWDHIKNAGDHGAQNWALEWIGMLPGKRESRRFLGPHVLNQNDLERAVPFPDRVAYGGWPMDTHPPAGIYDSGEPCHQPLLEQMYSIPLRSLYSRNIRNMFMAGRNMSATHLAFSSTRVMATCAIMGQAAGAAAAYCLHLGVSPHDLTPSDIDIIQQMLLKDDCFILDLRNEDARDLARTARVIASSERAGCSAANVINGIARRTPAGSNMWQSADGAVLPAWIELQFPHPVDLRETRLTFDTELSRMLTLTYYEEVRDRVIRAPQPETVKDYELLVRRGDTWEAACAVRGQLPATSDSPGRDWPHRGIADSRRRYQWVIPAARIFEIRCYQ